MLKYCWGKDGDGGEWLKDDERIVVRMVVRLKVRLAGKALSNVIRMDVRLND